jgi:hypothetical protein
MFKKLNKMELKIFFFSIHGKNVHVSNTYLIKRWDIRFKKEGNLCFKVTLKIIPRVNYNFNKEVFLLLKS